MMLRMSTMKLPSAPNTALFPAVVCTETRMLCRTLKVAVATFNTRSGRNKITARMCSIWVEPDGACARGIGD